MAEWRSTKAARVLACCGYSRRPPQDPSGIGDAQDLNGTAKIDEIKVVVDLTRSPEELLAENTLLRQQLIVLATRRNHGNWSAAC